MHSDDYIRACRQPESRSHVECARLRELLKQRVHHDVANKYDSIGRNSLCQQILPGVARGREKQIGQPIGEDSVDLLRHSPIPTSQPRLDVSET